VPRNPENCTQADPDNETDPLWNATTRGADRACDDMLAGIPTTFGKLVTLAGLRGQDTGPYSHPRLAAEFPTAAVSLVLQRRHEKVFAEWINLSLEEQHKQLTEFFCTMWTQGAPRLPPAVRQALVPAAARDAERTLFLSDLECMLHVMEVREP
jgi:hypothetical protein